MLSYSTKERSPPSRKWEFFSVAMAAEKPGFTDKPRKAKAMFRRSFVITVLVLVSLTTAAVVSAGMRSQRKGMGGMMGCGCCMGDMMGMGEMEGSGGMQGMEGMPGMGQEKRAQQPLTEGKKKVGEAFTCPVDGMRMAVTENTPATEYHGKTYYFCTEKDKQTFLRDPERYVKGK